MARDEERIMFYPEGHESNTKAVEWWAEDIWRQMKKSGGSKISLLANNKDTKDRCWCNCFIVAKAICAAVFVCVWGGGIMSTTVLEGEKKWVFFI